MKVEIKIVNAFIDNNQGGNPAGVVLNADQYNHDQKLTIAQKIGLSETAFVSQSQIADFKLDFYTPTKQIAHCGHATIAVFSYMAKTGLLDDGWHTKETIGGTRKIQIKNNQAYMEQLAPKYFDVNEQYPAILKSLRLTENQVLSQPKKVYTGNSFVVIGVKNSSALSEIQPRLDLISQVSEQLDLIGYYVFSTDASSNQRDATTRMFAPYYGIPEESATGMAAGPMACYLHDIIGINKTEFNIEQGNFMNPPSPSVINVNLAIENNKINSLMAGGSAKISNELVIEI